MICDALSHMQCDLTNFYFDLGIWTVARYSLPLKRSRMTCDVSEMSYGRIRTYSRGRYYRAKGYSSNKVIPELLQKTRRNGLTSFKVAHSCWPGVKGLSIPTPSLYFISAHNLHCTRSLYEETTKPSSKVEQSVKAIADELKEKNKKQVAVPPTPKRPLYKRIQDEVLEGQKMNLISNVFSIIEIFFLYFLSDTSLLSWISSLIHRRANFFKTYLQNT